MLLLVVSFYAHFVGYFLEGFYCYLVLVLVAVLSRVGVFLVGVMVGVGVNDMAFFVCWCWWKCCFCCWWWCLFVCH